MLEKYGHGGDLRTAEEAYGRPAEPFLDFSSNMNPCGPPQIIESIMKDHWKQVAHYPDPAVRELRQKLSETYKIPLDSILVGNGAAELIDLSVRVLKPEVTAITSPAFSEYEEAVMKMNGGLYEIPLQAEHDFVLQMNDLETAVRNTDLLILGHPNNPNGKLIPSPLLKYIHTSGQRCIIDEAFMDFIPEEETYSMLQHAAVHQEGLFVIRSMTKFFAIPGIRLGFVVAHPAWIRKMKNLQVQWSVNYLAQLIGTAILDEHKYIAETKAWLIEERTWMMERLGELGFKVYPSDVNFLLFSIHPRTSISIQSLQNQLGKRGILIRDASLFKGLNASYGRIAIRLRKENERLLGELADATKQAGEIR